MIKKWLAVGIILLFVGVTIAPTIAQSIEKSQSTSQGNWLYVGGSGPGNYTRIQDAIDNALEGDTVFVYDDSSPYFENLMINKGIYLRGENRYTTVIQPLFWDSTTITIVATTVFIRSFTIRSADLGVIVDSSENITIEWNEIIDNYDGIFIRSSSKIRITNNTFNLNHCSLSIENSSICNVDDNVFYPSPGFPNNNVEMDWPHFDTLSMDGGHNNSIRRNLFSSEPYYMSCNCWGSKDNIISDNMFTKEYGGDISSLTIWYGSERNIISNNSIYYGISIKNSNKNTIQNNSFIEDGKALGISISLESSTKNVFFGNTIQSFHLTSSDNNSIYYNNIKSLVNTFDNGHNAWNLPYPSGGNHWNSTPGSDHYSGAGQNETGADGIGDIPYTIPGGDNQDLYPLFLPFGMTHLTFTNISGGFGLHGTITNIGPTTVFRVYCRILIEGGYVILGQESLQMIPKPLLPGESVQVNSQFILGFGRIRLTIIAWADNAPIVSEKYNGILFLFFFFIR